MQAKLEAEVARLSSLLWSQSQLSPADADAGQGRSRSPLQKTTTDLILRAQTLTKSKFETETAALVQARAAARPPARPPACPCTWAAPLLTMLPAATQAHVCDWRRCRLPPMRIQLC